VHTGTTGCVHEVYNSGVIDGHECDRAHLGSAIHGVADHILDLAVSFPHPLVIHAGEATIVTRGRLVEAGSWAHQNSVHDPRVSWEAICAETLSKSELYKSIRITGLNGSVLLLGAELQQNF
jgi:hypothetical protein